MHHFSTSPHIYLPYFAIYVDSRKMTRFRVTVKLVDMSFNKDRVSIKILYVVKGYTALQLSKEFPSKRFN